MISSVQILKGLSVSGGRRFKILCISNDLNIRLFRRWAKCGKRRTKVSFASVSMLVRRGLGKREGMLLVGKERRLLNLV